MLSVIGDESQDVHGTMFRKMSKFAALGTFDFVTADGLFVSHHNEKAALFPETNELETLFSPANFERPACREPI
jgi:hypothetical protein